MRQLTCQDAANLQAAFQTLVLVAGNTGFGRIVEYGISTEGVFNGFSARSRHRTIIILRDFDGVDKYHGRAFTRIVLALGFHIRIGALQSCFSNL